MSKSLPSFEEASAMIADFVARRGRLQLDLEDLDLAVASGRVLAEPLHADADQPPFARSTRDGFACRAAEINLHQPLVLAGTTRAGESPTGPLSPSSVWEIMTGAPIPEGADAVAMIEHVEVQKGRVRLLPLRALAPGENIVPQGAQARAGDELLAAGTAIGFAQIALAAACGHARLKVYARPRVAILATGDELVPVASSPAAGQIRNSNAPMLAAMVAAAGGDPWVLPTAADNPQALDRAITHAHEADMLLISGGVSAGKFDLVEPALERAGANFHFTGVRIQPGKPVVFGELPGKAAEASRADKIFFFGLPGNPVSSAVTFLLFAAPLLAALSGSFQTTPRFALARLARECKKLGKPGLTRFLPAHCDFGLEPGAKPRVSLVHSQGSGDLAAQARSNCFLVVPEEAESFEADDLVRILLF